MKKHWAQLLPEAGRIADAGLKQISLQEKINNQRRILHNMEQEFLVNEDSLYQLALSAWSEAEIEESKFDAL